MSSQLHDQQYEWQQPSVIGRSFLEWKPGTGHLLTLGSSLSLMRPIYLQLCWYSRQGTDPSLLMQGNPNLLPSRSIATDMTWNFSKGRFSLTTVSIYDYRTQEIEQSFRSMEIDGQFYRVFTWINSEYSRSFTQRLKLSWRGQIIAGNLQAYYQLNMMKNPKTGKNLNTNNWEVRADITARPIEGWAFTTSGFYRSDTRSLYRQNKKVFSVNARVAKEFKRCSVYFEGRNLLGHPVITEFLSEDMTEHWEETSVLNQRLFLLGFTLNF